MASLRLPPPPLRPSPSLPLLPSPKPHPRCLLPRVVHALYAPPPPVPSSTFRPDPILDSDPIAKLHERVCRLLPRRHRSVSNADPLEVERYLSHVRQQQQKGFQKLKAEFSATGEGFRHSVDPSKFIPGDYVVHRKVGVGQFVGIRPDPMGFGRKYIYIKYADGMAKLPVEQGPKLLCRYSLPGQDKKPRTLNKLRDRKAWEKRRIKGQIAVRRMVVDLMELYVQRLKQRRPAYPKNPLMKDFIEQFRYEPTADQKQAFIDVENDLTEKETPMDRLICGDVGFGKTEVAQRAIFCVVSAGKQAMLLAPTIFLAKQHFDIISERFSPYPDIKVALLSRLQKKQEKEECLSMIDQGLVNIIVGTHSLLGSQVVYNNIGLLVIDEEQKFGVKQKEKIASLKTSVDVLTLTATPIPRTFYLALSGLRDVSLITTPPPERIPVKTHLSEYSKETIISAIKYELDRGGQVFHVLPRIEGLQEVQEFLQQSLPGVPIGMAHGKLSPVQLEETMKKFRSGKIRVLVSTNIVESGLDIPNANTMIIQNVQYFGMAQLYQLRGRVGRADKEAYAYLFYAEGSDVEGEALERLEAFKEFSELGQGIQLAERDMGIRGFGNIFGEEQTGYIGNVGVDLFFEMLAENLSKVEELRHTPVPYKNVKIDIEVSVRHSSEYINYLKNPLQMIAEAEKAAETDIWNLMQFTESIRAQYGKEPRSMEIILKKLYVRRMAADLGIEKIAPVGKAIFMSTNITEKIFQLMRDSLTTDSYRDCLTFEKNVMKADLLFTLPEEPLLNWVFLFLSELYACLATLIKC